MGGIGQSQNSTASSAPVATSSHLQIDPAVKAQMDQQLGGLSQSTQNFANNANQAAGQMQTNYNQYAPKLNTNFAGPNFSPNLDATSQSQVSQGLGNIAAKQAGANAQVANQFRGAPGASGILQAQNGMQGALAGNQLPFQAMQGQQARQAQNFELGQNAQNLSNSSLMQQGAAGAAGQSQTNSAIGNQLQMQNAGLGAQQNLMSTLGGYAGLTGINHNDPAVTNQNGIMGNIFKMFGQDPNSAGAGVANSFIQIPKGGK